MMFKSYYAPRLRANGEWSSNGFVFKNPSRIAEFCLKCKKKQCKGKCKDLEGFKNGIKENNVRREISGD